MIKKHHTAHVMLINIREEVPHVYLIQEKNKRWGIFGGGQEIHDNRSLEETAARELYEETAGSLYAHPHLFQYADSYSIKDTNGGIHKTFIVLNSQISEECIRLDCPKAKHPKNLQLSPNRDIIAGKFFPLYLVLSCVYRHQHDIFLDNDTHVLRYFFAEAIRRNKDYLYTIFDRKYLIYTEERNRRLGLFPVMKNKKMHAFNHKKDAIIKSSAY